MTTGANSTGELKIGMWRPASPWNDVMIRTPGPTPTRAPMSIPPALCRNAWLTDPRLVADSHRVLVVALEDCVVSDVHVRPELDVLGVKDQHARLEDAVGAATRELIDAKGAVSVTAVAHRSEVSRRGRQGRKLRSTRPGPGGCSVGFSARERNQYVDHAADSGGDQLCTPEAE